MYNTSLKRNPHGHKHPVNVERLEEGSKRMYNTSLKKTKKKKKKGPEPRAAG
jgi:hypothetical protein